VSSMSNKPGEAVPIESLLRARRDALLRRADKTRAEDLRIPCEELHDTLDQAASESVQAFELRLRNRDRGLLAKIDAALDRAGRGTLGLCEDCEAPISQARLRARPEANLCISCKELQEHHERQHGG
jgi:DnaK suppressor protein